MTCLGKDLVIVAGDIEKVFKEDDIRKRAEDEQKVCTYKAKNHTILKLIDIFFQKAKLANAKGSGRFG